MILSMLIYLSSYTFDYHTLAASSAEKKIKDATQWINQKPQGRSWSRASSQITSLLGLITVVVSGLKTPKA